MELPWIVRRAHGEVIPLPCPSCGARWPPGMSCETWLERMLSKDFSGAPEAAAAHGITVLTWLVQHPADPRAGGPEMRAARVAALARIAAEARDAGDATAILFEMARAPRARPEPAPGPRAGEMTCADIDPAAPAGHAARAMAWARSVAASRLA